MSEAFSISFIKVNRTLLHKSSEQSSLISDTGLNSSPRPRIPVSFVVQQQFLTMLCQFLLYSEVNQKLVYLYPLPIGSPSHPSLIPPIQVFTEHRAEFPVNETEVSPFTAKNLMLLHQKGHFLQIQNVTKHVLFTFRNWLIPLSKRQHLFFCFPSSQWPLYYILIQHPYMWNLEKWPCCRKWRERGPLPGHKTGLLSNTQK